MPRFKIIKGEGLNATIEKSNHAPTEFTIESVKKHVEAVKTTIKEMDAKIGLEKAMLSNIEKNHSAILKLSEKLRQACYLQMKSKMAILQAEEKLKALKGSMDEYNEELEEVKEQTGIDLIKMIEDEEAKKQEIKK